MRAYFCLCGQSDIENLQNKLLAGKNETNRGYKKFATAQFYGKFTF